MAKAPTKKAKAKKGFEEHYGIPQTNFAVALSPPNTSTWC